MSALSITGAPLVHVMTNSLSQNDCANLLLAVGARPIMAEAEEEAAEIAGRCRALVLNTGIPSAAKFAAMRLAGKAANQAGIPVVLDPVGIGASAFRREQIGRLLEEIRFTVIRGNSAEIAVLAGAERKFSGVDDAGGEAREKEHLARLTAKKYSAILLQSGAKDILTDGEQVQTLSGGHPDMAKVTGAGCMLSALLGAFLGASPSDPWGAARAAALFWKACAQQAAARMVARGEGTGSLRTYLIDAANLLANEAEERYED